MHEFTRNLFVFTLVAVGVVACSDSSTPAVSEQQMEPTVETDDSVLLDQLVFPDVRLADFYHCEYDRLSVQSSLKGMDAYAMADAVNENEVYKLWCRASGEDAKWCQKPEYTLLENPGTAGNSLQAHYLEDSFPSIYEVDVEQVQIPLPEESDWLFNYSRRVLGENTEGVAADEIFELGFRNTRDDESLSIPLSVQRYTVEGVKIELPAGSMGSLTSLASSPEQFKTIITEQIDALAVLVAEHVVQNFSGDQAVALQSAADSRLNRLRELVQLHGSDFHATLVEVAAPASCSY